MIRGGVEEAAGFRVPEVLQHRVGHPDRAVQIFSLEAGFVHVQQRRGKAGVVVEIGVEFGLPVLVAAQQAQAARLLPGQMGQNERHAAAGRGEIVGPVEDARGLGERRDHQPVPRGQHLVVAPGFDPFFAHAEQRLPGFGDEPGHVIDVAAEQFGQLCEFERGVQDVAPFEIAFVGHVVVAAEHLAGVLAQQAHHLVAFPDEEFSLPTFGIRVLGRVEPALWALHFAHDVVQHVFRDVAEEILAAGLIRFEIQPRQQRVVVQHLLEVRHEPARVDRIAVEPAAQMVVHAALRHLAQRKGGHVQIAPPAGGVRRAQEQGEHERVGKFWSLADAAVFGVVVPGQRVRGGFQSRGVQRMGGRLALVELFESAHDLGRRLDDFGRSVAVSRGDTGQHARKGRNVVTVFGREVGPAVERLAVRGQKDGHRPAAPTGQHLHRVHIDVVDVGPLLTVHLDVDEEVVHERSRLRVLERLVRHDVAPVASRIAHAEQNWLVFGFGFGERLLAPRIPIHGIVGMLQQIGAGLPGQPVGERLRHACRGAYPPGRPVSSRAAVSKKPEDERHIRPLTNQAMPPYSNVHVHARLRYTPGRQGALRSGRRGTTGRSLRSDRRRCNRRQRCY